MGTSRRWLLALGLLLSACGSREGKDDGELVVVLGGAFCPDGHGWAQNRIEHGKLDACGDVLCPDGFAQRIEGGLAYSMHNLACIVEGLRDRRTGALRLKLDHTFTNGSEWSTYTLFVTPTGAVELARYTATDGIYVNGKPAWKCTEESPADAGTGLGHGTGLQEGWQPTQRCVLKPVSFFEHCRAAVETGEESLPGDEAWACVYPDLSQALPWFESCVVQSPTCE